MTCLLRRWLQSLGKSTEAYGTHSGTLAHLCTYSHRARVAVSGDSTVASRVNKSVEFLDSQLKQGATVYGEHRRVDTSARTISIDESSQASILASAAVPIRGAETT